MNLNDAILREYSIVMQERDKALVERNNAVAALKNALFEINNLKVELGTLRINSRVSEMFEEYLCSPHADNSSLDNETLKDMTRAWISSSETITQVSATPERVQKAITTSTQSGSTQPAMPKSRAAVIRCSVCHNQGHIARDCRFSFPCERCKRFGHSKASCHVSVHLKCKICKVLGHTDERCWFNPANRA